MSVLDPGTRIAHDEDGRYVGPRKYSRLRKGKQHTWSEYRQAWLHPFRKGYLGDAWNEAGLPVSMIRCRECSVWLSVCPEMTAEERIPLNTDICLSPECSSYDPHRDPTFLMEA